VENSTCVVWECQYLVLSLLFNVFLGLAPFVYTVSIIVRSTLPDEKNLFFNGLNNAIVYNLYAQKT